MLWFWLKLIKKNLFSFCFYFKILIKLTQTTQDVAKLPSIAVKLNVKKQTTPTNEFASIGKLSVPDGLISE